MSNNDDVDNDLDVEDFDDTGFDDYSKKGTLGDLWRNNPMVKVGVILAGVAVVIGAFILFGGKEAPPPQSAVAGAKDVSEAPGSAEVSKSMADAIQEKNLQNTEEALRTNSSVVPMPVEPSKGTIPLQAEEESGEDPLDRWRRMQEERVRQQEMLAQAKQSEQPAGPPIDTKTPAVNALSQSMVTQLQAIMSNQQIGKPNFKKITSANFVEITEDRKLNRLEAQQAKMLQAQQAMAQAQGVGTQVQNIILPAGTIEYGQLLIEANTDAPGPVMAQIVSGPLSGSRVLGSFQSSDNYITLNFSQVVIDGVSYPVEAVAIDPGTTLPGMVTDIDRRYFKRVVLPMAAEFISSLAEAVSESGTTSVYISDSTVTQSTEDKDSKQEVASGITAAGDKLSEILEDEADNTKPLLRIRSGTPVGVLFLAPVLENTANAR